MARVILILTLLLTGPAYAQNACTGTDLRTTLAPGILAELEATAAAEPFGEGIAFEATRGGSTITLFGTFHASDPDIPTLITDRLTTTDLLLVEVTSAAQAEFQTNIQMDPSEILRLNGPALSTELTPPEWATLTTTIAPLGISPDAAERLRPWFATVLLAVPYCEIAAQRLGRQPLDSRIEALASSQDIPVRALEDASAALDFFADRTPEEQLDVLKSAIDGAEDSAQSFVTARMVWEEEKPLLLWHVMQHMTEEDGNPTDLQAMGQLDTELLYERNRNWLPLILEATATDSDIMVAVGALHLPRETGLLQMLADEGFAVSRLTLN